MTLGEAVAERVGHDAGAVVCLAARAEQLGQLVDPLAAARIEGADVAGLDAPGVHQAGREQGQRRGGGAGVLRPDPCLLLADDLGGLFVDGQAVALDGDLRHVVDEHRRRPELTGLVEDLVVAEAIVAQAAQLAGAPPGPGLELDHGTHAGSVHGLQEVQRGRVEELVDDRLRQRPSRALRALAP
jgi:hypothetical protein